MVTKQYFIRQNPDTCPGYHSIDGKTHGHPGKSHGYSYAASLLLIHSSMSSGSQPLARVPKEIGLGQSLLLTIHQRVVRDMLRSLRRPFTRLIFTMRAIAVSTLFELWIGPAI